MPGSAARSASGSARPARPSPAVVTVPPPVITPACRMGNGPRLPDPEWVGFNSAAPDRRSDASRGGRQAASARPVRPGPARRPAQLERQQSRVDGECMSGSDTALPTIHTRLPWPGNTPHRTTHGVPRRSHGDWRRVPGGDTLWRSSAPASSPGNAPGPQDPGPGGTNPPAPHWPVVTVLPAIHTRQPWPLARQYAPPYFPGDWGRAPGGDTLWRSSTAASQVVATAPKRCPDFSSESNYSGIFVS
jgi:hypothetical protein